MFAIALIIASCVILLMACEIAWQRTRARIVTVKRLARYAASPTVYESNGRFGVSCCAYTWSEEGECTCPNGHADHEREHVAFSGTRIKEDHREGS